MKPWVGLKLVRGGSARRKLAVKIHFGSSSPFTNHCPDLPGCSALLWFLAPSPLFSPQNWCKHSQPRQSGRGPVTLTSDECCSPLQHGQSIPCRISSSRPPLSSAVRSHLHRPWPSSPSRHCIVASPSCAWLGVDGEQHGSH
jgi:hypothetical protein